MATHRVASELTPGPAVRSVPHFAMHIGEMLLAMFVGVAVFGEQREPLSRGAIALRGGHTAIAALELACLGYVWTCAVTGRRDAQLRGAIGVLGAEGVGLVIGRGNCPLGPLQQRLGDPVPLFELVLPPAWARRAVPILAGISVVGIALALRPVRR